MNNPPRTLTKSEWPPNYVSVLAWRQAQLSRMRRDPKLVRGAREFYSRPENYTHFINHWLITFDPRNAGRHGKTAKMPFIMFQRQDEFIQFLNQCLEKETNGLVEKARDMGATWLCAAYSVCLWLFRSGAAVGWGSRKEQLVDKLGVMDSIFEKIRVMIRNIPPEFLPSGFNEREHMTYMRIVNPANASIITGEAGDNIGRGGRNLIYFKDESAHYERPEMIEAALGDNTRVQIDISSVNGLGNVFHRTRENGVEWSPETGVVRGNTNVFIFDYSDHPEKDEEWFRERRATAERRGLLHLFSQEVERNYSAAIAGVIIPADWVTSAIGAASKLGLSRSGGYCSALDVADNDGTGDKNAQSLRKGIHLVGLWSWNERDTGATTRRAIGNLQGLGPMDLDYDCIGMGSGVKAEANRLADDEKMPRGLTMVPWNAAAAALDADEHIVPDDPETPLNSDVFANIKAQGWWNLRMRFEKTHKMITRGIVYPEEELISIDPDLPELRTLQKELSQAVMVRDTKLRMKVDKNPPGTHSPNLADAVMMVFHPVPPDSSYTLENL